MVRIQVDLTRRQIDELEAIAKTVGKNLRAIIQEAVERIIDEKGHYRRELVLREAAGIWKARKDLPAFGTVRAEWDRKWK